MSILLLSSSSWILVSILPSPRLVPIAKQFDEGEEQRTGQETIGYIRTGVGGGGGGGWGLGVGVGGGVGGGQAFSLDLFTPLGLAHLLKLHHTLELLYSTHMLLVT